MVMQVVIGAAVGLVVVGVVLIIGAALIAVSDKVGRDVVTGSSGNTTIIVGMYDKLNTSFSLLGSSLPLLFLAIIGGIAIGTVISFIYNRVSGGM